MEMRCKAFVSRGWGFVAIYQVAKFCIPIVFIFPLREYVGWIKAMCSVQTDFCFLFFRSIKSSFIGITLHGGSGRCSAGQWAACGSMDLVVLPLGYFEKSLSFSWSEARLSSCCQKYCLHACAFRMHKKNITNLVYFWYLHLWMLNDRCCCFQIWVCLKISGVLSHFYSHLYWAFVNISGRSSI